MIIPPVGGLGGELSIGQAEGLAQGGHSTGGSAAVGGEPGGFGGELTDAINSLEQTQQSASSASQSAEALRCLAAIAIEQQDYGHALTLHKQLLEREEPAAELLYNIGLLSQKCGRAADAVRYYRQALKVRTDFAGAWLNLGYVLMSLGKHDEAVAAWQSAVRGNADVAEHFLV